MYRLRWEEANYCTAVRQYQTACEQAFSEVLAAASLEDHDFALVREYVELLPPEARIDSLTHPLVVRETAFLRQGDGNAATRLLKAIALSSKHPAPPSQWSRMHPHIDFDVIDDFPRMDRGGNRTLVYPESEAVLLREKLGQTWDLLRKDFPQATEYAQTFTHTLCIRAEAEEPTKFTSGSFRQLPGLSLLCNPHHASLFQLTCAVVHEAIHADIYYLECFGTKMVEGDGLNTRSPWTGASLSPDSLLQACFVWYGLSNLARLRDSAEAADLRRWCAKGFASSDFDSQIASIKIARGVREVLHLMRDDCCATR
jgi:hypothetical protein